MGKFWGKKVEVRGEQLEGRGKKIEGSKENW
jgi:hypothetical protein